MGYNIGPTISVQGEREYTRAMQDIRQNAKYLNAEMAKVTSSFKTNEKSVESLSAENKVLEKVLENQARAVEETKAVMERLASEGVVPTSKVYKDLEANLNFAEAAFNETDRTIRNNMATMEAMQQETIKLGSSAVEAASETDQAGSEIQSTFSQIGGAIGGPVGTVISKVTTMVDAIGSADGSTAAAAATMGLSWAGVGAAVASVIGIIAKIGEESYRQSRVLKEMTAETKIALGLTAEEAERFTDAGKRIYTEGFADSLDEAMNAILVTKSYLKDLDDTTLEKVGGQANIISETFKVDIKDTIKASSTMIEEFGLDAEQALDLITATLQTNPMESSEFLSAFNEFSVQFREMGFSAEEFATVMATSMDNGAWSIGSIANAFKELNVRAKDGSESTKEALTELGLNADVTMAAIAGGGEGAQRAIETILRSLDNINSSYKQNSIGVALMGSMWEDVGSKAILSLANVGNRFSDIDGLAAGSAQEMADLLKDYEKTARGIEITSGQTAADIAGAVVAGLDVAGEAAVLNAEGQVDAVGRIFDAIGAEWEKTVQWFSNLFSKNTPAIKENVQDAMDEGVTDTVNSNQTSVQKAGQNIGNAMIDGAVKGIQDSEKELIDQTAKTFGKAATAARKELDIHSPSGVFKEIGGYVSQGFALGINENLNQVMRAAGQFANAAVPRMSSASVGAIQTTGAASSQSVVHHNENITINPDARQWSELMNLLQQAKAARQTYRAGGR